MKCLLALLLILLPLNVFSEPRLSLTILGSFGSAPAMIRVTMRLDPHQEDRGLHLELDGDPGEYRASFIETDGWKLRQYEFKAVPEGCYVVRAVVFDASGKILAQEESHPIVITGRNVSSCQGDSNDDSSSSP